LLRRKLRSEIQNLQKGMEPNPPQALNGSHIPTFGGDTILRIPADGGDDAELIKQVSRKIAAAYVEFQDLADAERRAAIGERLAPLNVGDTATINPSHGKIFEFKPVA